MSDTGSSLQADRAWEVLRSIPDPEIPVLSIVDLGVVRRVDWGQGGLQVDVTPTYSGCPAAELILAQVRQALVSAGFESADVNEVLAPPWTTDWISEHGREKLRGYGIAPPEQATGRRGLFGPRVSVACPRCGSRSTDCVSEFGSTPCKAQYRCLQCLEPFDYFKCL